MSAGFAARIEDTRLPNCVMFGEMVGARAAWGARKKSGWGVSWTTSDPSFGINADHWTIAARGEGEWRRTTEQGAECFMANWITAEKAKAGLRYAIVCMSERDGKDKGEDSPKQAGSCWFARHS